MNKKGIKEKGVKDKMHRTINQTVAKGTMFTNEECIKEKEGTGVLQRRVNKGVIMSKAGEGLI